MNRIPILLSALLFAAPVAFAGDDTKTAPPPEKAGSPQEQFDGLKKAFDTASRDRQKALQEYQAANQQMQTAARRVLDFAEKHGKDAIAFDALTWLTTNNNLDFQVRQQAAATLVKDHASNEKIGSACTGLVQLPNGDKHVREIMAKNMSREVQGQARLALGSHLKQTALRARSDADKERQSKEAEQLLQEAVDKYADVKIAEGTVGDAAKTQLEAIKAMANLAVGKTVPEIEGPDLDGKDFKLSDYRGKVVMLDFWGHW